MTARLQRALCLSLLTLGLVWLAVFWARAPLLAWAGLFGPVVGYGLILAGEFVLLARHGVGAAPGPGVATLLSAWWAEWRFGLQVFAWRQPFRAHAQPDHLPTGPARGVVFVHGLMCNRGFWTPWMQRAQCMGLPYMAVDLEPVFSSIDAYVATVGAAVARLHAVTGQYPMLVCHSMGGLAARAWLRSPGAADYTGHVVTIGSPHAGTWMARFGRSLGARQMSQDSDWLRALARTPPDPSRVRFICWYSDCDNIVFPTITATLLGADNRFVPGRPMWRWPFIPRWCGALWRWSDGAGRTHRFMASSPSHRPQRGALGNTRQT